METKRIEISYKTIVFTVLFLISLLLVWQIRSILVLFYISFILMEAFNPSVKKLEKLKIPRVLAIFIIYILFLAVVSFALSAVVPVLIEQTTGLIQILPDLLQNTTFFGTSAIDLSSQFRIIESLPANIARATISIFGNVFSAFVVFVITFYLLLERQYFERYSFSLFGHTGKRKAVEIIEKLESTLGRWVNAQLFLMTLIGLISYIGYLLLGLNFAVPLAIAAGLLEIVPNIGPTISTILAGIVGLTMSPITGLFAVGWGILVQQLENNFIVPKLMKESVGINPIITILLIAAGSQLGGVMGAILSVPIYLTAHTILSVLIPIKTEKEKK